MSYNRSIPYNGLPSLPPPNLLETIDILKLAIKANKLLAELKGYCQTLPNPHLLLNTIILQESKESSAIENIVTTQDELYKASISQELLLNNPAAKEVLLYREAMYWGLEEMKKKQVITTNLLIGIMQKLKQTTSSIRSNIGTKLANPTTKDIVYTPPEGEYLIREKLAALEIFMNDESYSDIDPLIKMALIHYQFEAIHPFADGNGRTGRILNVLYLLHKNLIGLPVLYLSYYIIKNKGDYYRLLREVTEEGNWAGWISFLLKGVADTAAITLQKINAILLLKKETEALIKDTLKASYTREFSDLLYSYPYIKIKILEQYGIAKRQTASTYLQSLSKVGILRAVKVGKEMYYINHRLLDILSS